ncbi:PREDICTED: TATA element modulatory factor isoform X1 [Nanorana parkeri]|uniref:TATA element modulatory factor isoform X1 n=1 Tax=Nanorana parkeri TaxID=125878 RepID=UPI000854A484|nr:PREDICTED: TATA element modulatory factor isoform X1 [Nanorana parkeri]
MSWFNASHLSTFAKQALSQAQKSIDRVLDIKEDETAWADSIITPFQEGTNSLKGSWENSNWGGNLEESQTQVVLTPTAITKPVRRTVVDESENFFSAFLTSSEVNPGTVSSVVSTPPAKSQRPKEEVKQTSPEPVDKVGQENAPDNERSQQTSPTQSLEQVDLSIEDLILVKSEDLSEEKCDPEITNQDSGGDPESVKDHLEPKTGEEPNSSVASPETKDNALDLKDQKLEDRQSNTPSPPVSNFSSGTSTTSDIEVLDHDSVISESSVSSRQEVGDSKGNLNLMQNSFQLLSPSVEYGRLDEFQKLTESCSSSDAFERIDSFSVQSLDSRSISEINSDDELSGRGCTLVAMAVSSSPPSLDVTDSTESKTDEEVNETVLVHSSDDIEMEESGRCATPVNSEQPDLLVTALQAHETEAAEQKMSAELQDNSSKPKVEYSVEDMHKIIDELTTRLDKREIQLLSVSKEKALLEETLDNLRDELVRVKEESHSISLLKDEFTHRIAEAERRAQLACKERDTAKKEVKTVKEELATRLNSSETAEIMREKDEQIQGLLEEGEKLSKQQLHNSNIIKKLRAKEKEHEHTVTKQGKKIRELEDEMQLLKQTLDGKEELEKQHRENIRKLNGMVERQEKDVGRLQAEVEEVQENNRSLQSALDSSYKELAELHKANATKASEAQEVALSCEIKAKEEMCFALEKAKEETQKQQEALAMQVTDLRIALQRAEQQAARKEDYLRQEIAELQQRLQEGEARNQELSQSVTSATRPLLRQIENLQATLAAQTASWEKLEKNLSDRLTESQTWLASAVEKERASAEELLSIKIQISAMESQNSLLRQEKCRLQAQLEVEKSRLSKMEEEHSRNQVELENLKMEYKKMVEEARKEKNMLTNQLEMEKMRVEQEKKKVLLAQEAVKEKERKSYGLPSAEPGTPTPTLSRSSSVSGVDLTGMQTSLLVQDESHDNLYGSMTMSISGTNLYDAVRMGAGSSVIENLQSQLKLREGEIAQLQLEIGNLEKTRSILAEEVVKLNNLNDELEEKVKEIPILRAQMKDLDQRYNTILQMYGEKAEEAEELRLDLEDVKNMYKTQIDELLQQQMN